MTSFEFIILVLIYSFCYGYAFTIIKINNESIADTIWRIFVSFIIAFYAPMIIGVQIAHKLND